MRYDTVDPELFIHNRAQLAKLLKPNSIVILHSNDVMPTNADGTMPFKQNADLLYLSGIDQEESILVLYPDASNKAHKEILFVKETNKHIAIWEGAKLDKAQAQKVSGITNIMWTDTFESTVQLLAPQAEYIYLHTNDHLRANTTVETRNARYIKSFQQDYPLHKVERLSQLTQQLRPVKHDIEVEQIRKACEITRDGFIRVLKAMRPNAGEWEMEAEYSHEFLRQGSRGFAYAPIIGSGANANVLHYIQNDARCKDGELVLMDVGAEYANWNADMTRTIPVSGKFTKRQRAIYEAVLRVMKFANSILRPGILPANYHGKVLEFMETELINLGLIDPEEAKLQDSSKPLVKKYFMHGTSHHLGLDVHDVAPAQLPVAVGHVYTIEPGIYIQEENIGIRLENNVYIGEKENRDLMHDIPLTPDEIESIMNQ